MATRRTGPVKPPVLDMEARQDGKKPDSGKPGAKSFDAMAMLRTLPLLPLASGLGGALIGVGLAYTIAAVGLWPQSAPPPNDNLMEITTLERRLEALESAQRASAGDLSGLARRLSDNEVETVAQLGKTNEATQKLSETIATLQAIPTGTGVDAETIEALKSDFNSRIEALASAEAPVIDEQITTDLSAATAQINTLTERLQTLETQTSAATDTSADITSLQTRLDEMQIALQAAQAETASTPQSVQLPLALSGLETALGSGRPFAAELAAIQSNLPDVSVPTNLANQAVTGLQSPKSLADDLSKAVPELLAAIPIDPDASWQDRLMDQAKSVLALRPVGEVEGDSPQAQIARLEAAIAEPDFVRAERIITAMPQPLRALIPDITSSVSALATAQTFLTTARNAALAAPSGGASQ